MYGSEVNGTAKSGIGLGIIGWSRVLIDGEDEPRWAYVAYRRVANDNMPLYESRVVVHVGPWEGTRPMDLLVL